MQKTFPHPLRGQEEISEVARAGLRLGSVLVDWLR